MGTLAWGNWVREQSLHDCALSRFPPRAAEASCPQGAIRVDPGLDEPHGLSSVFPLDGTQQGRPSICTSNIDTLLAG